MRIVDLRTQREFLIDLEELVEQLFAETEDLRQQEATGPVRRELLASIFRHVHSIKGIAATAGFNSVSELAHQTETLLDGARSGRLAIAASFVELIEDAANAISESLSAIAAGGNPESSGNLVQSIHNLSQPELLLQSEMSLPDLPVALAAALNEQEKESLREALREDERIYLVDAEFDLQVFDREFPELRTLLAQQGVVISSLPSTDSTRPDRVGFRILYSSALALIELQDHLAAFPLVAVTTVPLASTASVSEGIAPDPAPIPGRSKPVGNVQSRDIASGPASSSVRIEISELDRLVSAAHELFGQTVSALDLVSDSLAAEAQTELKNLDAQIRQSLVSLEEQIIELRMVSLERVMQRAIRAGRVAARISGKLIEFTIVGSAMRIDKVACDAIADPLLHLVRNAVDQGIESPEERLRTGKSALGQLRIEASASGGRVRVAVTDDGRGIDPEVISRAAISQGLITPGTLLSSARSLRLIFRPGFSTATTISSVSGRGVGLDIVERAIERAGGAVRVRTQVGQGTEFEIRLPASLGVLRTLVVVSGGQRYCVDASQIADLAGLELGITQDPESTRTLQWRDETLPLSNLWSLLAQSPAQSNQALKVLICNFPRETTNGEAGRNNWQAIAVEAIEGTQEVLVRGLGRHAALWPGVVGAAELWDGTVALVLDLPLLLSHGRE